MSPTSPNASTMHTTRHTFSSPTTWTPAPQNVTSATAIATTMTSSSADGLEVSGRHVEKMLHADSQFPSLVDKLRVGGTAASLSGLQDPDYPALNGSNAPEVASLRQMSTVKRVPLPAELVEHFGHMQCNCMMGLFTEVERAWLTIDSDIYVWKYEDGTDLAYFDGLSDTILSVALLKPKKDIFQGHIKHLLCLTTAVEIILLGVGFGTVDGDSNGEMHLLPEPLFTLPTDATFMMSIRGTSLGRIFMGGKDGSLYEFAYKADDGWFGKKATKINHSTSSLSFLVPSFVNTALYEEDAIVQIEVDDTRNALYTRSEKGVITVFDLGRDGTETNRVCSITQAQIVQEASKVAQNVDKSNFSPLVGISPLSASESVPLSLLAVSGNGVRYYFSTCSRQTNNPMDRPMGNLVLQHVRLPPGFSASSPVPKPSKVHMSYYRQGTLLLASAQSDDTDLMWLLSSDGFPFQTILMEGQSTISLDGRVWALDEVPSSRRLLRLYSDSFGAMQPPLAVVQHAQTARKFVLISAHGTQIVSKLRPADHLRQLLIEHGGPDNDVIKAFFSMHTETQAAATCLVLASSQAVQDSHVAEWATRAFFLYGGEPRLFFPGMDFAAKNVTFHPHLASTPAGAVQQSPFNTPLHHHHPGAGFGGGGMPEMHFSFKHNGLYLFFSRLVRPVWLTTLVIPGNKETPLASTVDAEELDWIMAQLFDLASFLERNSAAATASSSTTLAAAQMDPQAGSMLHQQKAMQEALLRERQSMLFLQQLVGHSLQVLGLWRVVLDHQFHAVANLLSLDEQNMLRGMYFRDLIISASGKELSSRLVQSVIEQYLADNASTDAISNRMRTVCPALYHSEDAISSKAHEILISAKAQTNPRERDKMLQEAVKMSKDIAGRLNLEVLASHLAAVHCYTGVVEICLAAAAKRDPQNLALHYYKNGEPMEDHQGMQAFITRMSCYKNILEMLRRLLDTSTSHPMNPSVPKSPGPPPPADPNQLPPSEASEYAETVLKSGLQSDDQLFHVAIYQWLVEQAQFDRLLGIRSSFLEDFLTRGTKKQPETIVMFDLLWKYYEKTRSYACAAKILSKLADRHSTEVNLHQRLEYLSRAIMCVKSGELGGESSKVGVGELLHDLEEKMEVARVQLQIVEALSGLRHTDVSHSLSRLNSDLLDISQLYQDFAEPYHLWESQLAILHCSGHHDPMLIETMWENIIDGELARTEELPVGSKVAMMGNKMRALGKVYAASGGGSSSSRYFPVEFIVRKLELFSSRARADHTWVFSALMAVGISLPKLLDVYNRLYSANEPVWLTQGTPNHLLYVLAKILESFADSPSGVSYSERRQFTVVCLDAVGQYLGNLYTKHDSNLLVKEFRGIQAKLERL